MRRRSWKYDTFNKKWKSLKEAFKQDGLRNIPRVPYHFVKISLKKKGYTVFRKPTAVRGSFRMPSSGGLSKRMGEDFQRG